MIKLFQKKKKDVDAVKTTDDVLNELKDIRKQLESQDKRIDKLEKKVSSLREFASQQTLTNRIFDEAIKRLKNDVNALKQRTD